jgi:hypothetical protein
MELPCPGQICSDVCVVNWWSHPTNDWAAAAAPFPVLKMLLAARKSWDLLSAQPLIQDNILPSLVQQQQQQMKTAGLLVSSRPGWNKPWLVLVNWHHRRVIHTVWARYVLCACNSLLRLLSCASCPVNHTDTFHQSKQHV